MQLRFVVSRTENFFFFITNLSAWHSSCRPDYNEAWLRDTPLSTEERVALADVRMVLARHTFRPSPQGVVYAGTPVFLAAERLKWAKLHRALSEKEYEAISHARRIFQKRHNALWDKNPVMEWRTQLSKTIRSIQGRSLLRDVAGLLDTPKNVDRLTVHLLASPSVKRAVSGGANLGRHDITLEVPICKLTPWNVEIGICVLVHEYVHTRLDTPRYRSLLQRTAPPRLTRLLRKALPNENPYSFLAEIVGDTIAPYGYLCSRYCSAYEPIPDVVLPRLAAYVEHSLKKPNAHGRNQLLFRVLWRSYPLVKLYTERRHSIDRSFLRAVFQMLESELR